MVYVVCGIRVTEKEVRKQIKPEKRVEKPLYCQDTGQLIGTRMVTIEKEEVEYRFGQWSSTSFDNLIHQLKFAEFSNDLYIHINDEEFYIGQCLAYGLFYDPCLLDMEKYNNCVTLVAKHFPHQKIGLWIYEEL